MTMYHGPIQSMSSVYYSIRHHDVDEVRRLLLTKKFPINGYFFYKDPPIIKCIRSSRKKEDEPKTLEMLKILVQHGADVNIRGRMDSTVGMTAAMIAAAKGLESCLRFLVESGTDLTLRSMSEVDYFETESEEGVNYNGKTALMLAASGSDDANALCVKYLVEAGVDLNVQDESGNTALMLAAKAGGFNSVKYLTERMSVSSLIQTNNKGQTALMIAASNNSSEHTSCLKCLVEAGADLNVQNTRGRGYTALMYASESGNVESVKFPTERMSVSTLNQANDHGQTALMLAASHCDDNNAVILKHLLEAGADVNVQCRRGYTALMYATELGKVESVKILTERISVSTLNQMNDEGQTALMLAVEDENYIPRYRADIILENLVEAGADVNIQCKRGYTALMRAASRYVFRNSHLLYLITARADLNVADTQTGWTALMWAIKEGNHCAVNLLLEKGALVNIVTPDLKTPLFLLSGRNNVMITKLLSHGLDPALSFRDQRILHTLVADGEKSLVRGLVMNGFPPVDVQFTGSPKLLEWYIFHIRRHGTPVSPLTLALARKRFDIARYLIVNRFFTRYDLAQLCRDKKLRQSFYKGNLNV